MLIKILFWVLLVVFGVNIAAWHQTQTDYVKQIKDANTQINQLSNQITDLNTQIESLTVTKK